LSISLPGDWKQVTKTIEQLKQRIWKQTDPFFILMAIGKDMASENTVGDYKVEPLAMIHMIT